MEGIGPYQHRALLLLFLLLIDTVLTSHGTNMVLPVFQVLLDSEHKVGLLVLIMPVLVNLEPDLRLTLPPSLTVTLSNAKVVISMLTTAVSSDFLQRPRFHCVARIDENFLNGPYRRLAKPDATTEEIEGACRLVGADKFIRSLPDSYAALVGDCGYSLSGAQRKRATIVRVLIRQPEVLMLD